LLYQGLMWENDGSHEVPRSNDARVIRELDAWFDQMDMGWKVNGQAPDEEEYEEVTLD